MNDLLSNYGNEPGLEGLAITYYRRVIENKIRINRLDKMYESVFDSLPKDSKILVTEKVEEMAQLYSTGRLDKLDLKR